MIKWRIDFGAGGCNPVDRLRFYSKAREREGGREREREGGIER